MSQFANATQRKDTSHKVIENHIAHTRQIHRENQRELSRH